MPKSRVPDGPRSKAGKERAKQEKEAEAARRELNVRKIAALENAQSAVSAMERTPEANRRLNTTTTTKDTPASRESTSDDEVEDQEEDNMDVDEVEDLEEDNMDVDKNKGSPYESASESSTDEPAPECDDGPSEPASEPDEAPKGSRKKKEKMPVRVAINNYRAHEEPIVVASTPSSDFAGGQPRAPVKRIVSQGKRRMESHTLV